jgi:hypothetical protein
MSVRKNEVYIQDFPTLRSSIDILSNASTKKIDRKYCTECSSTHSMDTLSQLPSCHESARENIVHVR